MIWIHGGPLLEVSILLPLETGRIPFAKNVVEKLRSMTPSVSFAITESELQEKINEFNVGYPVDANDQESTICHRLEVPAYVASDESRKAVIHLGQISDTLVTIDFSFFGAEEDQLENDQRGVSEEHIPFFKHLLDRMYDTFDFVVGTIGYDTTVTTVFDTSEGWPSDAYDLHNIDLQLIHGDSRYTYVIVNKEYIDAHDIRGMVTVGQKQTIETVQLRG